MGGFYEDGHTLESMARAGKLFYGFYLPDFQKLTMIRTANLTGPVSRAAGGLYESVRRLVQELQDTGLEVSVLGAFDKFTQDDIPAWDPVTVRAFRSIGPTQFGYSPGYLEFLRLYRPQILHTHGIWIYSSLATHSYAVRHRVPYMVSPHGMLDPWAVRNSRWKKTAAYWLYERVHLRDASVMRALCESEAEAFRKFGLKNPIAIIPNGVDLPEDEFTKLETRRNGCAATAGSANLKPEAEAKKTLLFLGRIHPKKGLPNLIRAFAAKLKDQCGSLKQDAPWQLVIAGWDQGGHEAELVRLCKELGLSFSHKMPESDPSSASSFQPAVLFFGPAFGDDKKLLLHSAHAFILPSFSEGLPMSVLEAWSYYLPVLITPECNLPEGFAADAAIRIGTDTESIAQGLDTLFSMAASDLQSMGSNGRTLVEEKFTWKSVAARMREVYDCMLNHSPMTECLRFD